MASQANNNKNGEAKGKKEEGDLCVITFRNHHHAFDPSDPNVTFVHRSRPLSAPRRLLSFVFSMVMVHYFMWIIPMFGSLIYFYNIGMWYVSAALLAVYLPTYLNNDQFKKGRPWNWLRTSKMWGLTSRYIDAEVIRTKKLDPTKKYMFGLYPHGILILSRIAIYGGVWERLFPGIETRVLAASPMFYAPGSRELCLWMGGVDAAKRVAVNLYKKFKLNLMVYPGGSDEIFETDPNLSTTTLIVRKGFIKLAVQQGAELVPAFVFGEKWLYKRRTISPAVKEWFMRHLRMPLIVFWGRYFTWLPFHDRNKAFLSVVFGSPIPVTQQDEPSEEYINELWEQYIGQTKSLYETYKGKFGYPEDETLVLKEAVSTRARHHHHKAKKEGQAAENNSNGSTDSGSKKKKAQ